MGWFNKKKEESEEAVVLPELPDIEDELSFNQENLPRLPQKSFDIHKNLLNEKEVYREKPFALSLPRKDFNMPIQRMNEVKKEIRDNLPSLPKIKSLKPPIDAYELPKTSPHTKEKPIYIRLDKFEATENNFEEIKKKVVEIESFLRRIKEIKTKEEKELIEWERELQIIKTRIESIDREIFSKLD